MTRDEAIAKIASVIPAAEAEPQATADWVDALAALGLLKLDEPKCANERAVDALFERASAGMITPRHAIDAITEAGLKIVEKGPV